MKYSRQREAIIQFLRTRTDHPTADVIYQNVKLENPKVSLGTVYRNLTLLTELGEIQKISMDSAPDRFDGNTAPHCHFCCKSCGSVLDIKVPMETFDTTKYQNYFSGDIESMEIQFFGTCPDCKMQNETFNEKTH